MVSWVCGGGDQVGFLAVVIFFFFPTMGCVCDGGGFGCGCGWRWRWLWLVPEVCGDLLLLLEHPH